MKTTMILPILEEVIVVGEDNSITFLIQTSLNEAHEEIIEEIDKAHTIIMQIINKNDNIFKRDKTNGEEEEEVTNTLKINKKMGNNISKDKTYIEVEITKVVEVL